MASFDYDDAAEVASSLIQFFGMDAMLRRDGVDRPCQVAVIEYNPREQAAMLTNPTDRRVLMSAIATPPDNEQDKLVTFVQPPTDPPVIDEILPMTCKPKVTAPAGIAVFYEFSVRG